MKTDKKIIDARVYGLITTEGFVESFWKELAERRSSGQPATQVEVFLFLNELYRAEFGQPRFPTYGAFRKTRDRMH